MVHKAHSAPASPSPQCALPLQTPSCTSQHLQPSPSRHPIPLSLKTPLTVPRSRRVCRLYLPFSTCVPAAGSTGLPRIWRVPGAAQLLKLLLISLATLPGEERKEGSTLRLPASHPSYPLEQNQWPEAARYGKARSLPKQRLAWGNQMVFLVGKRQTVCSVTPAWCQVTVRLNKQPQRLFLHPDQPRVIDNLGSENCLPVQLDPHHDSSFSSEWSLKLPQSLDFNKTISKWEGKHLSQETLRT